MSNSNHTQGAPKSKNRFQASGEIQNILDKAECSICLPYELSIIEIDRVLSAIRRVSGTSDITLELSKGDDRRAINAPSAFDIWDFVFDNVYQLPTAMCRLIHSATNSTLIWDDDERFVLIAGSRAFCENAFPHSYDVLELFYVQSTINEFEDEKALREYFSNLTTKVR